jgi:hypothetical protein
MGAAKAFFAGISWRHVRQKKHGSDSKRKHQVEGAIMQAKEWTRTFGRCNPVGHTVTKQQGKHECTKEEPSQEEVIGKSLIHLFVHVL